MLSHIDKIVNSTGLICDLIGAWFVAWEVVRQFGGSKYERQELQFGSFQPKESLDYRGWELNKYFRMKIGLTFLTIGFILQIISNWIISIINFITVCS